MRPVSQGELLDMDYNCRTGRDRLSFCPSPPKVRRVGNWGPKTEIVKQNIGTWTQSTEWEWDQLPLSPSLFRYAGRVTKTVIDRLKQRQQWECWTKGLLLLSENTRPALQTSLLPGNRSMPCAWTNNQVRTGPTLRTHTPLPHTGFG